MHALIIEDEYLIALDLEMCLSELGYRSFEFAATEEQAVTLAMGRKPDLITADMRLREGDGASAVRRITEGRTIPVVYVTGSLDELEGVSEGIIVSKPFDTRTLAEAVEAAQVQLRAHFLAGRFARNDHGKSGTISPTN